MSNLPSLPDTEFGSMMTMDVMSALVQRVQMIEEIFLGLDKAMVDTQTELSRTRSVALDASNQVRFAVPDPTIQRRLTELEIGLHSGEFAARSGGSFVDSFRGELEGKSSWCRGEIYRWKGALFVALKDGAGKDQFPHSRNRSGRSPIWLGLTGFGSPGAANGDGPAAGLPGNFTLVSFPASASAPGVPGNFSFSNGFMAVCTANNTWVFGATTSDYPL